MNSKNLCLVLVLLLWTGAASLVAQHDGHNHDHAEHNSPHQDAHAEHSMCGHSEEHGFDPASTILGHIADANEFHLWGDLSIPLPVIIYSPERGTLTGMSSMFHHGHSAVDGYVLNHGRVNHVVDASFPQGEVEISGVIKRKDVVTDEEGNSKEKEQYYVCYDEQMYLLEPPSTLDGGLLGGGITSFYDFSITKNVFTMLLAALLLILLWNAVAKGYRKNEGKAPSGIQSFIEPFFIFIRDEVSIPMIGEKHYERFQPLIMTLFFFILFCNLLGLVPFFPGSANITGNIAVTLVLAVIAFIVTNINGNKHYWEHVFWMPGVPAWVKTILTPVEVLGLFIKPFSLMVRLFANISAGHIMILSLISLIFIFGNNGESLAGASVGAVVSTAFVAFMNLIELLVAFLQAFVFAILTASYIGAAVEDHEHHDHEHAH